MKRIAQFYKVSEGQFEKDWKDSFPERDDWKQVYDEIKLPRRATSGSAGYDFFTTTDIELDPGETIKIPTGVRAFMEEGWVLKVYPRSGLGFKFRLQLNNTVGIIDSDYFNAANEGHIFIKITNDSNEGRHLSMKSGEAFAQGLFIEYGITFDDECTEERIGGLGSTSKKA